MNGAALFQGGRFIGSFAAPDEACVALVGIPFDGTTSFQPGTRFGPARIREASYGLEEYSPDLDRGLEEIALADLGDVELPFGNVSEVLERAEAVCRSILAQGAIPLAIGGEHLISLPLIRACHGVHRDLAVIQFDAHADLRDEYLEEEDSHATVMRRAGEIVGADSIFQIGIRSGTREEFRFGRAFSGGFYRDVVAGAAEAAAALAGRPVYVTVDIDVVDPGFAPGTGTPEPGGCTPAELLEALRLLAGLQIVGFDLVEVNPLVDVGFTTAILGAKVIREAALMIAPSGEDRRGEGDVFGR